MAIDRTSAFSVALLGLMTLLATGPAIGDDDAEECFRPTADPNGILDLPARQATLKGDRLRLAEGPKLSYVTDWVSTRELVRWDFELAGPGRFIVLVEYAAPTGRGGALFEVVARGQVRQGYVHATGKPTRFYPQPMMGPIELPGGANRLEIRALEAPRGLVMNLRRIRLVPAEE